MARLTRFTQKLFGTGAGSNQMAEFGSLEAGTPMRYSGSTITPSIVQALSNYTNGWFSAVIGQNSPAIEDMNSLFYLSFYQLSYLFQLGVPEWDSSTTYYIGSIAQNGSGITYYSIQNNNTGNALTNTAFWTPSVPAATVFRTPTEQKFLSGSGTYTTPSNPSPLYLKVTMVGGGGGGGASGSSGAGSGGTGSASTFGGILSANPGIGGVGGGGGGQSNGGTATFSGSGVFGLPLTGGGGGGGGINGGPGGIGGSTALGGAGYGQNSGQFGAGVGAGMANTGAGGGGAAGSSGVFSGGGGSSGGYLSVFITGSSLSTIISSGAAYSVGTAGAAGSAGVGGTVGGVAGSGLILVEEFYQ